MNLEKKRKRKKSSFCICLESSRNTTTYTKVHSDAKMSWPSCVEQKEIP